VLCVLALMIVWVMVLIGGGSAAMGVERLGVRTTLEGTFALFFAVFWVLTKSFKSILILLPAVLAVIISGPALDKFLPASRSPAPPPLSTTDAVPPPSNIPAQAPSQSEANQPNAATALTPPPVPPLVTPQLPTEAVQPPVAPPNDQQFAMVGLEVLRHQIAQWVSGRSCALLDGELSDSRTVTLNGLVAHGSVEDLRQGLTSLVPASQIDLHVIGVDRVFCPTLTALHPTTPAFGASGGPRLALQIADGKTRLHNGERIRLRLVMPDFASRLRVDYIAHDGNVQHLYPQLADPKAAIIADPPRTFEPNEPVNLGHPSWQISEPYGTDMVIAVASSEPLFERPRPSNTETAHVYLRDLQAAIDALRQRGARLAGAAVTLEALP
jgi:hypothetical protein